MNPLEQLFAQASRQEHSSLTAAQQIIRLKEVFEQRQEKHTFTTGQIVAEKNPEMSPRKSAQDPLLFVEYLEEPIRALDFVSELNDLVNYGATDIYDCIVASVQQEAYLSYYYNSSWIKPAE